MKQNTNVVITQINKKINICIALTVFMAAVVLIYSFVLVEQKLTEQPFIVSNFVYLFLFSIITLALLAGAFLQKVHHIYASYERKKQSLQSANKKVAELEMALNAHAIVAITDSSGVITQVNDKFCSISQYAREELIGNTHQIINSGVHSKEFFKDLWQTLTRNEVWNGDICNRAKDGSLYWVHQPWCLFLARAVNRNAISPYEQT
ncbi:PAS domain-containing protein [Oceanisphaera pacifica]|uniref:PAS domain S-box protein n=1 Tax=Oceanisphaera pacifica TaxID=2818389 RepID=A0ABS3NIP0_9GAMM|nr:PAS domain-containing protein [Oceanisphaera pacifica]MBO1520446.1 PAS domain S-box protein [Oceanisphaera pacifica]